ncbi:MAG TPA: hypothetical protein PLU87_15040 [Sedimentisphaerales bacterium]|nr:hypothetical protein [Sedimentisphaerales bacterium]HRS12465.1 hypothetical protein [Sedimentisphaerales bacterium]HRV49092.1 hypothetical protein [Sedimentisphaerales bacterium]
MRDATKAWLIKGTVILVIAVICGSIAGVLFSLFFYGFIPAPWRADMYLSDTEAKMKLRFWAAFAVGAIFGAVWSYRIVKDMDL